MPSPTSRTALLPAETSATNPTSYGAVAIPVKPADIEEGSSALSASGSADDEPKPSAAPFKPRPFKEIGLVCFGLWTSVFCAALSASVTANLQTDISSYFKAGHLASWLGGAFLLGNAALTPLWGRLSNIIGRRQAMLSSIVLFILGTLGCAVSTSMMQILAARFVAGCGGGGMLTITAIIVSDLVSLQERGLYQGFVNQFFGLGSATGAVLGGWVGDNFGWRWAFGMQLLPLFISMSLILWKVHVPHKEQEQTAWQLLKRIDWLGCFTILTSVTSLMLSLSLHTASGYPLSHPLVYSLFIVFGVSTIAFYFVEEHWAEEPLIPMVLLKESTPAFVLTGFLLLTMSTFARLFMLPLYLHVVRGYNGSKTGIVLLPSTITGAVASLYAGWHIRQFGTYKTLTIVSAVLPVLSAISICLTWSTTTPVWRMALESALASWGGGVAITAFLVGLIAACSKEHMAIAVSASYLFRSLGQVLGVAVTGAVQQWALTKGLHDRLKGVDEDVVKKIILEPSVILPTLKEKVYNQAILAYLDSIDWVFAFALVLGVLMVFCAVGMRSFPLPGR